MKRGRKLARRLRARILAWEQMSDKDRGAFKRPGGKPGNYANVYGGK